MYSYRTVVQRDNRHVYTASAVLCCHKLSLRHPFPFCKLPICNGVVKKFSKPKRCAAGRDGRLGRGNLKAEGQADREDLQQHVGTRQWEEDAKAMYGGKQKRAFLPT